MASMLGMEVYMPLGESLRVCDLPALYLPCIACELEAAPVLSTEGSGLPVT